MPVQRTRKQKLMPVKKTETGNDMKRRHGLTLPELLVTLAIAVIVGSIALPLVLSLNDALKGSANAQTIVSTAVQNARALAMKEGRYAGVRFQQDKDGNQYAIYIVYGEAGSDPANGLQYMYKVVEGRTPVQLPEGIAVTDMVVRTIHNDTDTASTYRDGWFVNLQESHLRDAGNLDIEGKNINLTDTTSFSIVFDAKGQLAKVPCKMRCIDVLPDTVGKSYYRPGDTAKYFSYTASFYSLDKVFNGYEYFRLNKAKFIQDDYANLGLGGELSRVQFKIFDMGKYKSLDSSQKKYDYLNAQPDVYVNQFTGKLMGGQ